MNSVREIDIRNCTYYFLGDMINIKSLDSNKIKIDKKSYKNISIYHIGCVTANSFQQNKWVHWKK